MNKYLLIRRVVRPLLDLAECAFSLGLAYTQKLSRSQLVSMRQQIGR